MRGQRASLRDVAVISEWKVTPGEEDFIDFRADLRSGFGRAAHRYYSVREFRELQERRRSWLHLDCTFCTIGVLGSALLSRELSSGRLSFGRGLGYGTDTLTPMHSFLLPGNIYLIPDSPPPAVNYRLRRDKSCSLKNSIFLQLLESASVLQEKQEETESAAKTQIVNCAGKGKQPAYFLLPSQLHPVQQTNEFHPLREGQGGTRVPPFHTEIRTPVSKPLERFEDCLESYRTCQAGKMEHRDRSLQSMLQIEMYSLQ